MLLTAAGVAWLAARLFRGAIAGLIAAVLLVTSPIVWHTASTSSSGMLPLAAMTIWLAAVDHARDRPGRWWDALAGAALGLGVYTSAAAVVMMPLYFALTVAVLCWSRAMTRAQALAFAAAFAAAAAPLFASWLARPELFRQVVSAHHLYDAARFNPLQGVHEMVSWVGLTARTEVFYDYFNPAFLFLSGRVFLAPLVVLVPIGLYQLARAEASAVSRLIAAAFFAAPFAAALLAEPPSADRALFFAPSVAIASASALVRLRASLSFSAGSRTPALHPRP